MTRVSRRNNRTTQTDESSPSPYRDRKARRGTKQREGLGEVVTSSSSIILKTKTDNQKELASSIRVNTATFATGVAGSGKTFVSLAVACQLLLAGQIKQIIMTKPMFEIDEELGTLPGDKDEKLAVLTKPMRETLNKLLGSSHVENLTRSGKLIYEPLGSILGNTYDDAFVFVDETQNATIGQVKALLTRLGERSKIVLAGDYKEQRYLEGRCGLEDALYRLRHLDNVGHVDFTVDDIVRSSFCKDVIIAYRTDPDTHHCG